MKPQVITLKRVKAKALEAYKARKLTAQARNKADRICQYRVGSYCCAVGAAMSKATLDLLAGTETSLPDGAGNEMDIGYIRDHELVVVRSKELAAIVGIQIAHDTWAKAAARPGAGAKSKQTIAARTAFLELIAT